MVNRVSSSQDWRGYATLGEWRLVCHTQGGYRFEMLQRDESTAQACAFAMAGHETAHGVVCLVEIQTRVDGSWVTDSEMEA